MKQFGLINSIVADEQDQIVARHARAEGAKLVGIKRVPITRLSHLSEP